MIINIDQVAVKVLRSTQDPQIENKIAKVSFMCSN